MSAEDKPEQVGGYPTSTTYLKLTEMPGPFEFWQAGPFTRMLQMLLSPVGDAQAVSICEKTPWEYDVVVVTPTADAESDEILTAFLLKELPDWAIVDVSTVLPAADRIDR